jgi:uncharacterized protein (DUF1501 family)
MNSLPGSGSGSAGDVDRSLPGVAGANSGYRALVCVFLAGGNDSNNLIVPSDVSGHADYAAARGPLALPRSLLLRINPANTDGREWGLHPAMAPLHELFEGGKLAILANVGASPPYLFSHAHQQALWLAGMPENACAPCPQGARPGAARVEAADLQARFPNSPLGRQLAGVAQHLAAHGGRAAQDETFVVHSNGWDLHENQVDPGNAAAGAHAVLLSDLSLCLRAFHDATLELGLSRQVTTYTASEFGRTLSSNRSGGSDHGWGSHQLVLGGAILGRRIHGQMPDVRSGSRDDDGQGRWIPTTRVEDFRTALAQAHDTGEAAAGISVLSPKPVRLRSRDLSLFG